MTYVYDIMLDFQKEYYDFFEWNSNDDIVHIRKIPLFKVTNKEYELFKSGIVRFDKDFLYKIFNKSEKYKSKTSLDYAFLISTGFQTMGLKLNKGGINVYKSSLLIDEDDEISDIASEMECYSFNYKIIKKNYYINFLTRNEKAINKLLSEKLKSLYYNKENDKLKYLYLECFNKSENDIKKIYKFLIKEIGKNNVNQSKLYNFFKIT